ncbi:glycosyltransferase [uncultured Desulfobacter sp.]|uniref:glycosyltransferase n=1 Tax=uncultured Desulfobacter sp. TaxID=240139 RepID=UPI0029F513CF|nr:glycosyltransferase [uncultured Desulfobacter sp.]
MSSQDETIFIVFSDDWGEHPSSCQHLFKCIGSRYRTLWINTVGLRTPKLSRTDIDKAIHKIRRMFTRKITPCSSKKLPDELTVVQPFMLPFQNVRYVRHLNKISVRRAIQRFIHTQQIYKYIVTLVTAPNGCDYVGLFDENKIVYYCVDDFSEWPGHDKRLILEMEDALISKSDLFFATADTLFTKLKKYGKPVFSFSHGVDVELFSNLPGRNHHWLDNIPRPIVGYFGLFDDRSDQKLLADTAKNHPDVSFVITGNVVTDVTLLEKEPNVYFTGPVPYQSLPAIVAGWDICMLPYKMNALTESINPLKLKEYIATGKPVISTPLPEVVSLSQWIHIHSGQDEWRKAITQILSGKELTGNCEERRQFIHEHSWENKALFMLDKIFEQIG